MEERIAKVREVVRNVSANDIVLALHNFELDVEKTIQAFCEGGSQTALGDWEQTGGVAKKQKRNKSKKAAKPVSAAANLPPTSSVVANNFDSISTVSSIQDGYQPPPVATANGVAQHKTGFSSSVANNNTTKHVEVAKKPVMAEPPTSYTASAVKQKVLNNLSNTGKNDSAYNGVDSTVSEASALNEYTSELRKLEHEFEAEVAQSEANLSKCFQELHQSLVERERQLRSELSQCRQDGFSLFSARQKSLHNLFKESAILNGDPIKQQNWLNQVHLFNNGKGDDQKVAYMTRFVYDNSSIINGVSNFGQVISLKGNVPQMNGGNKMASAPNAVPNSTNNQRNGSSAIEASVKHSTSHSSLVSSVGEDSGLGQISPIQQEKNVKVENGGIVMESDGLSADQLNELQRHFEETLRAKGIDPSVLNNLEFATVAPRRRQQQQNKNNNHSGNNNNGKSNGDNKPRGATGKNRNAPKIDLSILK